MESGEAPSSILKFPFPSLSGNWAVAVSGGADSVALLLLLHECHNLKLHVVHLNHETRAQHSDEDAEFVRHLADSLGIACTISRRSDIEPAMPNLPANTSAKYRAVRFEFFRRVVRDQQLDGVMLAHHADDQAETVLQRLLRGAGYLPLGGIQPESRLGDLRVVRPLLKVRRSALREFLRSRGQPWREDASNESDTYQRNRVRKLLAGRENLTKALLDLGEACRDLRDWTADTAPAFTETFPIEALQGLPTVLAHQSARNWLISHGSPPTELSEAVIARLIIMATDVASPSRQQFPGNLTVRRRSGQIGATH